MAEFYRHFLQDDWRAITPYQTYRYSFHPTIEGAFSSHAYGALAALAAFSAEQESASPDVANTGEIEELKRQVVQLQTLLTTERRMSAYQCEKNERLQKRLDRGTRLLAELTTEVARIAGRLRVMSNNVFRI